MPGETPNQQAIGNVLASLYSAGASGGAATILGTLLAAGSVSVRDGLSGGVGTGVQNPSFAMGDASLGSLFGQAQRWRDGQAPAPAPGRRARSAVPARSGRRTSG